MKCVHAVLLPVLVLAGVTSVNSSSAQTGWAVVDRGADYKVLQNTTVENGTNRVHRIVEMATGLCYTNSYGQLVDSSEQITILPQGGAIANQGRHTVTFPADIGSGVLKITTPSGQVLQSRPICVTLDDGKSTAVIGVLTNAAGWLTASNQVTYKNCFCGIHADLVCTYRKSGFECDLVFRSQPPAPSAYGLSDADSTIQLATEFFNTQDPQQIPVASGDRFGLQDVTLKFGKMVMAQGRAFSSSGRESAPTGQSRLTPAATPVYKSWLHLGGRTFLIEQVPLVYLADQLDALPLTSAVQSPQSRVGSLASAISSLPPANKSAAQAKQILIASADMNRQPGVVLDYNVLDSDQGDFTFASGGTYLISGNVSIGTATFEPGTVLKFPEQDEAGLACSSVVCATTPYDPAVFTSMNDNSVGEGIAGSSGTPATGGYNYLNIYNYGSTVELNHCQFKYAGTAVLNMGDAIFNDVQFYQCYWGIVPCGNVTVNNALVSDCYIFCDGGPVCQNATFANCNGAADQESYFYNCTFSGMADIVTNYYIMYGEEQPAVGGSNNSFDNSAQAFGDNVVTGSIVDAGNTTADKVGLYWWTTQGPIEGTTIVDLGYHTPAVDGNGNPVSTLVSGVPDYISDASGNGLPDAWQMQYFGNLSHFGSDLDPMGNTLSYDFTNSVNLNAAVLFTIESTNDYVNYTNVMVQLSFTGGLPYYLSYCDYAVFLKGATETNWLPFVSTNLSVNLGTTDGVYDVVVGLRGYLTNANSAWSDYSFTLDRVAPVVNITNPVIASVGGIGSATVIKPYLQLQGFATEQLSSLSYDISNATGMATNLDAFVTDRFYDTNKFVFTTNYFHAYDVPLATNDNAITLRVTDRAGNTTTTNITVTLDYTTATNPPVVTLLWPQDGMAVSGANITIRGTMSDETGTIVAQVVNGDGTTSTNAGMVERNNMFWIENVPLNGTSQISIQATDGSGRNVTTTNFTVLPSSFTLTINSTPAGDALYQPSGTVSGTVGDASATVTVNGVAAAVNGNNWSAANVPNHGQGTATFDASATAGGQTVAANVSTEMGPFWFYSGYFEVKSTDETDSDGANTTFLSDLRVKVFNWSYDPIQGVNSYLGTLVDYSVQDSLWTLVNTWWWNTGAHRYETDYSGYSVDTDLPPNWDPFGATGGVPDEDLWAVGDGNGTEPLWVYHYFGDGSVWHWHWDYGGGAYKDMHASVGAATTVTLFTGGKSGINRQSVFSLQLSATEYSKGLVGGWAGCPCSYVDNSKLQVMGKTAGNDGIVWVSLPDNSEQDMTVTALGVKSYNAGATPQKYYLVHRCECPRQDLVRTTVGVGEFVDIFFSQDGSDNTASPAPAGLSTLITWNTTAGSLDLPTSTCGNRLRSPNTAASATVTATVRGEKLSVDFKAVEPSGVISTIRLKDYYNIGQVAAGMEMNVFIQPTTVSFSQIQMQEPAEATTTTDYFNNSNPAPPTHANSGAGPWHGVDCNNLIDDGHFDSVFDQVGWPIGVSGTYTWPIHPLWRVLGDSATHPLSGWTDQVFTLYSDGTMRIDKLGHNIVRHTYENYGIAQ